MPGPKVARMRDRYWAMMDEDDLWFSAAPMIGGGLFALRLGMTGRVALVTLDLDFDIGSVTGAGTVIARRGRA